LVEPQLSRDAIHGACQLFSQSFRRPAKLRGDVGPRRPLAASLSHLPFLLRHAISEFLKQLRSNRQIAGSWTGRDCFEFVLTVGVDPAVIARLAVHLANFADELVPGHGHEEFNELLRLFKLILTQGGANEKAGQNRLANIDGVEIPAQARIAQPQSNLAADFRLIQANQLRRGLLIPGADALHKRKKRRFVHGSPDHRSGDYSFHCNTSIGSKADWCDSFLLGLPKRMVLLLSEPRTGYAVRSGRLLRARLLYFPRKTTVWRKCPRPGNLRRRGGPRLSLAKNPAKSSHPCPLLPKITICLLGIVPIPRWPGGGDESWQTP